MIHEVDELLEKLVKRDALNGSTVELAFDAPTKDWVARRNAPTVDLYLYDIREDLQRRVPVWEDARGDDGRVRDRQLPPRRFKLSYLVTAWTQRPEDEHRLLSALLSAFIRNPMVKVDELDGTLAELDLPVYIDVGQPPAQDRSLADVWSALGGELKPSLDLVVTAPIAVLGCIYLFYSLSGDTKLLFFGWAAIGLVVYFAYSRSRSHVGLGLTEVHETDADAPPQPVPPIPGSDPG